MTSRLGLYRLVQMPGGHELLSTNPHGLADKIIEAGSTAEPPVAAQSVPDQRGRIGRGLSGDEWTDAAPHHVAVCRAAGVIGRRLVNGFVNETPRNERDGVERSVMAWTA